MAGEWDEMEAVDWQRGFDSLSECDFFVEGIREVEELTLEV